MPNPLFHIDIALESVATLPHQVIEENLGCFLLGSCAPDIRIITRGPRDDTHFAPITNRLIGTGTKNMFKAYPHMRKAVTLSERTQAFIAGYISHLVADEAWIIKVYQPYFGNRELFQNQALANVMDRALQLEMDRVAVEKHNGMKEVRGFLADAHVGVDVSFLPQDALVEYGEWLAGATQRGFTWERLRFLASRRQEPEDLGKAQEAADQFLEALPWSLEWLYERVPKAVLRSYRDTTIAEWTKIVREYLP